VVMAGTGAEYATTDRPAVEGVTPLRPATLYGACKTALHVSSAAYLSERGVGNAWGHVFHPYGPGEHLSRLVPCAIRTLASGQRFVCDRPNDIKDFIYVEDVARAFVELLASEVDGDVNIVSGEPISVRELVDRVAMEVGRPDLVDCAASAPEASRYTGEPGRLVREVGWAPRWTVNDGVAATVAWWANRLDGPESIGQDDALGCPTEQAREE
jgi:nucleoside-diphosphate-sugar epimerase